MLITFLIICILMCYGTLALTALHPERAKAVILFIVSLIMIAFCVFFASTLNESGLLTFTLKDFMKYASIACMGNAMVQGFLTSNTENYPLAPVTLLFSLLLWGATFLGFGAVPHGTPMPF